ncbi:MAG: hypothetical protein Q7J80_04020, partial [Anaerolineales bacterium]|nr:hypothetical protein [Anaerolineales bacterium]
WVKLYVREPGSKELRACAAKAEAMAASVVAYPEARRFCPAQGTGNLHRSETPAAIGATQS